jgi:hypothetical protein
MSEQRYVWYPDASINQWAKVPWAKEKDTEFALHEPARDSRSQEFDWGVAWRDDLRKGWHVVPMGARYVGVSGAVEGQNCAPFGCGFNAVRAAARLNAGIESASLMAWHVPEWSKLDDSVGSVLDLHDLGDKRATGASSVTVTMGDSMGYESPAKRMGRGKAGHAWSPMVLGHGHGCRCGREMPAECNDARQWLDDDACFQAWWSYLGGDVPAPRFVVKPASEMREGEPCSASGIPQGWTLEQSEDRVRGWCAELNGGLKKADTFLCWHEWEPKPAGYTPLWGLVDTHSPEWKAFQAKRTSPYLSRGDDDHAQEDAIAADLHRRSKVAARAPEPSKPSDAEIVEAWDGAQRHLSERAYVSRPWFGDRPHSALPANVVQTEQTQGKLCAIRIGTEKQSTRVHLGEYRAARSRELNRRVTASSEATKEAERRRVLGPIDDPEHA